MPDAMFPVEMISGVPVVVTPEEVDITNAAGLRAALSGAATHGHGTFVVDMTRTLFCDTAGLHALVGANKRAQAEGGQVLLVFGGTILRIFEITGLDRVIPYFTNLEEALAQTADAATQPAPPSPSSGAGTLPDFPSDNASTETS